MRLRKWSRCLGTWWLVIVTMMTQVLPQGLVRLTMTGEPYSHCHCLAIRKCTSWCISVFLGPAGASKLHSVWFQAVRRRAPSFSGGLHKTPDVFRSRQLSPKKLRRFRTFFLGTLMLLATDDVNGKRALGAGNSREIDHESLVWEETLRI